MKGLEKMKNVFLEVIILVVRFFKPYKILDEKLEIPKDLKRMGFKVGLLAYIMTVMSLFFAFVLKITNWAVEAQLILLGIILFMLYRGQHIISEAFRLFDSSEEIKFESIFNDEIIFRGSQIIGIVSNKVLKYNKEKNIYEVLNNEAVLNAIKNYLKNMWEHRNKHLFNVLEMISIIIMLIVSILTNTSIDQTIFVPMILIFVVISFFSSAYIQISKDEYYTENRKYDNEQEIIKNDLLRVPIIVKEDLEMRIKRFQNSVIASNENIKNFYRKTNSSNLIVTILETFSQYGVILVYILGVEWDSISLATIAEISATLVVVETALNKISELFFTLQKNNERLSVLEKEEEDIGLIMKVYNSELSKTDNQKAIDHIDINPFTIRYFEESENDRPFTLISKNPINIDSGEIVILQGPSGSGKSTFMKMLTEKIRLKKDVEVPSTSRFLFFDEKLKFGSLSIFEELFCCNENPDFVKMQNILENLHLWSEIKSNCVDIWRWMKEKKFEQSLSNGQKQRLILAKMLYFLDNDIDVVVLDECTSGLDDKTESDSADAERILEYIVKYVNMDKQRIVIISTHQNIDGLKNKLANEYKIKTLEFKYNGEYNLIKEI